MCAALNDCVLSLKLRVRRYKTIGQFLKKKTTLGQKTSEDNDCQVFNELKSVYRFKIFPHVFGTLVVLHHVKYRAHCYDPLQRYAFLMQREKE